MFLELDWLSLHMMPSVSSLDLTLHSADLLSLQTGTSLLVTLYVHSFTLLPFSALLYLFVFKLLNTVLGLCYCSLPAGTLKDTGILEISVRGS